MKKYLIALLTLVLTSPFVAREPQPLKNFGCSCYTNAGIQSFYALSRLTEILLKNPELYKASSVLPAGQKPLITLYTDLSNDMTTTKPIQDLAARDKITPLDRQRSLFKFYDKVNKEFGGGAGAQQDPTEFLTGFLDQLINPSANQYFLDAKRNNFFDIYIRPLFQSHIESKVTCPGQTPRTQNEPYNMLLVEVPPKAESLYDCLQEFFKEEKLENKCTRQLIMKEAPEVLILGLKRFTIPVELIETLQNKLAITTDPKERAALQKQIGQTFAAGKKKIERKVIMPRENLNLAPWKIDAQDTDYELIAAMIHRGKQLSGGHYIAYVKYLDGWYLCNDSVITKVTDKKMLNEIDAGYAFIYQKVERSLPSIIREFPSTKERPEPEEKPSKSAAIAAIPPVTKPVALNLEGKLATTDLHTLIPTGQEHNVTQLNLRANKIEGITPEINVFIGRFPNLETLLLGDNPLTAFPDNFLAKNPKVKVLGLARCKFTDFPEALKAKLSQFTFVNLEGNPISAATKATWGPEVKRVTTPAK